MSEGCSHISGLCKWVVSNKPVVLTEIRAPASLIFLTASCGRALTKGRVGRRRPGELVFAAPGQEGQLGKI